MALTILGVVLGAIISIVITIWIENLRKPRLDIQLQAHSDGNYEDEERPAKKVRFLHLKLVNKALPGFAKWMTRQTAVECHGVISFHHLDGQNVFGRNMPIRWTGSPEPVPISVKVGNEHLMIFDPSRLTPVSRVDVPAGEAEAFDVAARFDNEEECYGWCNENYFSNPLWRNPDWKLAKDRYLIKVTITSAGQKVAKVFRLINDVAQQDFRLEPALETDRIRD